MKASVWKELLPAYLKVVREKSVRIVTTKQEAFDYLSENVFSLPEFDTHIGEVAEKQSIPKELAFEIITNYLTHLFYEIDIAQHKQRRKTRITIPGYMQFNMGQAVAIKAKKFTLLRFFKPTNNLKKQKL